ncbi:response regulator [Terasakiella sp. SH-1]|uniref:response regulator n=1 Tax=Terasakiella sp. SH-1 TaxID=2560057 RepID=UPI00107428D4|nr:response regulator [Terasakiella sp. SH-1]
MNKTVLIVEDNEMNMKLFNDLLQAHSYNTVQTNSGHNVKELIAKHQPDLIILDIQLPEISGFDIAAMLKNDVASKQIPLIAVTAFAMKGDQEKILQAGCDGYLSKPISVPLFLETVSKFLA